MPVYPPPAAGGGTTALTIAEVDGNPSLSANALIVSNGSLTNSGGGTATVVTGGGGGGGSVTFYDEGSAIGTGTILNFVGAGVTATFSGGTAIATIAGGGGSPDAAGSITNTKTYAGVANGGTVALGFTPTNGRIILAYVSSNQHEPTSLVQTNVTWTQVCSSILASGNEQKVSIWLGVVAASPGTDVVMNFTGNNAQGAAFEEFSGLSTVDGAEGYLIRTSSASEQNQYKMLAWPGPGGRAICVVGNSTGNAIAVPTGWTRNIAAGSYGGSSSCSILTRDESATGNTAAAIYIAPVAVDVHVAAFVHLVP